MYLMVVPSSSIQDLDSFVLSAVQTIEENVVSAPMGLQYNLEQDAIGDCRKEGER